MTNEYMTTRVEIHALAADQAGLWMLGGLNSIRPPLPIGADSDPHSEVELAMAQFGLPAGDPRILALHSTSWRPEGTSVVLTYMAVIDTDRPVREVWPEALPITLETAQKVGKPIAHHPADAPLPRHIDVVYHGIRHLHWLIEHDAPFAANLSDHWRVALAPLKDLLAGLYSDPYVDLDESDVIARIDASTAGGVDGPTRQAA